jgi:metal-responsive CopG/Arc/MetJ family transcriptional regulator
MKNLKMKVSVTVAKDLLEKIDGDAKRSKTTRSQVIDRWLRHAAQDHARAELDEAVIAYYSSLTDEERAEEEAIARASSRRARRLKVD